MVRCLAALSLLVSLAACGDTKTASIMPSDMSANYWNNNYYAVLSANSTAGTAIAKPLKLQ